MSDELTPDDETPTYGPRVSRLRRDYERQSEASNLLGAFGNSARSERLGSRASRTLAALTRHGGSAEGLDIADFEGEFDPTDAGAAVQYLGRGSNAGQVRRQNKVSDLLKQRGLDRREEEFNTNILPTYTGAMDRMDELAGTNAISAEQEGLLRSQIAATNRTSAASNLGRVASALGLRGMSNSPAAAALASSVAQDYDVDLSNQLSDLGLDVSRLNREQARQDSGAAASLATLRINAENAYLANDQEAVQNIGRDTAALIDALYSRDKTFDLMEQQIKEAGRESTADRIGQWVDIAGGVTGAVANVATMGATGAIGGGGGGPAPSSPPATVFPGGYIGSSAYPYSATYPY